MSINKRLNGLLLFVFLVCMLLFSGPVFAGTAMDRLVSAGGQRQPITCCWCGWHTCCGEAQRCTGAVMSPMSRWR